MFIGTPTMLLSMEGLTSEAEGIQERDRKVCRCVARPSLHFRIIYILQLRAKGLAVSVLQAHHSSLSLPQFLPAC